MDLKETHQFLTIMKTAYQKAYRNQVTFSGVDEEEVFAMEREIWQRSFSEFTYSEMMIGFEIWLSTEPFPPTVAEMRSVLAKVRNPKAFITAERAWEEVAKAVRKFGWPNEEKAMETLSSNAIRAIQNIGGWKKLCSAEGKEWDFRRKDFIEIYDEFERTSQKRELIPQHVLKRIQEETVLREGRLEAKLRQIEGNKLEGM